jgi:hypothetical protein
MQPILLSTAYFPPISWIAVALQSGSVEIEIHETYLKQTYRNRCNIATASGILSLTVPVKRVNGNHTKTADIQIDNSEKWQLLHWRSIITAYNKSPYFLYYRDIFEPVFYKKYELLIDLNWELFRIITNALQINSLNIFYSTHYVTDPDICDLRNCLHPKIKRHPGMNIEIQRYMQTFEENIGFIPDLSILDLIFNLGPEALPYLANLKISIQSKINALMDIQS